MFPKIPVIRHEMYEPHWKWVMKWVSVLVLLVFFRQYVDQHVLIMICLFSRLMRVRAWLLEYGLYVTRSVAWDTRLSRLLHIAWKCRKNSEVFLNLILFVLHLSLVIQFCLASGRDLKSFVCIHDRIKWKLLKTKEELIMNLLSYLISSVLLFCKLLPK